MSFFALFNLWLVTSSRVTLFLAVIGQKNPFFVFIGYCLLNVQQEDFFIIDSAWAIIYYLVYFENFSMQFFDGYTHIPPSKSYFSLKYTSSFGQATLCFENGISPISYYYDLSQKLMYAIWQSCNEDLRRFWKSALLRVYNRLGTCINNPLH